jgi:hypothetical protein
MAAQANGQFRFIEAIGAPAILDGWMPSGYVDPTPQRILLTELAIGY